MKLLTIKDQLARDAARHAARRQKPVAAKQEPSKDDIIARIEALGGAADKRKSIATLSAELAALEAGE
jgi:hypothetical protein